MADFNQVDPERERGREEEGPKHRAFEFLAEKENLVAQVLRPFGKELAKDLLILLLALPGAAFAQAKCEPRKGAQNSQRELHKENKQKKTLAAIE